MSNPVPEGWSEYRQGDIVKFYNGRAYKLTEWEKAGTPVIRLQNLTGSGKEYYYSNLKLPEHQYCQSGDLLYMWSATFGPHIWKGSKAIYHYHIWKVVPDEVNVTKSYLYQLLGYKTNEWLNQSNGMGILHVTKGGMEDLSLVLPPLPEQQKIAATLSAVDDVIEKTRAQIDKLKDLKTGMMQELLTKGIGSGGVPHTEFKDSPVGRIPVGWDVVAVGSVADVIDPQPDHRTPAEVLGGVPYVGLGDIGKDGKLDFIAARKVAPEALHKQVESFNIDRGAFIFGKIGTIGKPMVVPEGRFYCLSANVVLVTTPDLNVMKYLYQVFSSGIIDEQVLMQTNTTSQPALGIKKVREFCLPLPRDKAELSKITASLNSIDSRISNVFSKLSYFGDLKKALMQDLLTGKVRVNVDTKESAVA